MRISKKVPGRPPVSEDNLMGVILLIVALIAIISYAVIFEIGLLAHILH